MYSNFGRTTIVKTNYYLLNRQETANREPKGASPSLHSYFFGTSQVPFNLIAFLRQVIIILPFCKGFRSRGQIVSRMNCEEQKLKNIKPDIRAWSSSHKLNRLQEVNLAHFPIGHTDITQSHYISRSSQRLGILHSLIS